VHHITTALLLHYCYINTAWTRTGRTREGGGPQNSEKQKTKMDQRRRSRKGKMDQRRKKDFAAEGLMH
jgi:hypothetical protein